MTAATVQRDRAAQAPVQQGLAGIEPAPTVHEIKFAVVGQLQRMAEVRISADGEHAHLVVQIMQPPHGRISGIPVVAVYHAPASEIPALEAQAHREIDDRRHRDHVRFVAIRMVRRVATVLATLRETVPHRPRS